jgi:predicted membrane channel-forming protein YqfA (hemolysin III family)
MSPSHPRDKMWLPWFRHPALRYPPLRTGLRMGVLLSLVLTAWLILANRVGVLDRLAIVRNAAALAVLFLIAFEPIARFRNSARDLLVSGGIGWAIGSLCYFVWTMYFHRLAGRMGAFHIFVLGAAVYLFMAVVVWIGGLIRVSRHHHLAAESKLRH